MEGTARPRDLFRQGTTSEERKAALLMAPELGRPGRRDPPLNVVAMAIVLVLAAFAGAGIGLVWQSSGLGDDAEDTVSDGAAAADDGTGDDDEEGAGG